MKKYIFLFSFTLLALGFMPLLHAQKPSATISGYLTDAQTGELLIGANIYNLSKKDITTTNAYGFYSLTLPKDSCTLQFSYIGYQTQTCHFNLVADTLLNIALSGIALNTIEITSSPQNVLLQRSSQMSKINLRIKQIEQLPALGGESDLLKAISLLPGVSSGLEGTTGLLVRGGSNDQNLMLLDGTTVYNAAHLFGYLSVFNTDALRNVEFIKGGFPARYGGRLSSVLDIAMKDGNMQHLSGTVGVSVLSSRLTLEVPIVKNRTSLMLSGRYSYLSLLMLAQRRKFEQGEVNEYTTYDFYDLNAKLNHKFDDKNRLFISFYKGRDDYFYKNRRVQYFNEINSLVWGNTTAAIRYNRVITPQLFAKLMLVYADYRYALASEGAWKDRPDTLKVWIQPYQAKSQTGIRDLSVKIAADYLPSPKHTLQFGIDVANHYYTPGIQTSTIITPDEQVIELLNRASKIAANEISVYLEDDWEISPKLKINVGLRSTGFWVKKKFYAAPEPRLSLRYLLPNDWAVKASYSYMQQYIHLLTNSSAGLPNDIWVPATEDVPPQISQQIAVGLAKTIQKWQTDLSIEAYYKQMNNLIDFVDGAIFSFNFDESWIDIVEKNGRGWAYGFECFAHRKIGKLSGWVSYTMSYNNRKFENINKGKVYPFKYDRRHNFSVTANYQLSKHFSISATWTYQTGNRVTLPTTKYFTPTQGYVLVYTDRNGQQLPDYHRADIGLNFAKQTKSEKNKHTLSLSVYNIYNRHNAFYLVINNNFGDRILRIRQRSLLPILPSLGYSFNF